MLCCSCSTLHYTTRCSLHVPLPCAIHTLDLPVYVRVSWSVAMSLKSSSDIPDKNGDGEEEEEVEKKRKSVKEWFLGAVDSFGFLSPCDPSKRFHRYQMLVFMCLLSFG